MTKIYLLFLLFAIFPICWGQIDVDELLIRLHRDYEITGKRDYLKEKFTVFESTDRLDKYHVFLDSIGLVREYIHLSIVHYVYDEKQRIVLIEGFSSQGERYYWDFPPITKYRYVNDTIIPYFTHVRKQLYPQSIMDTLYHVTIEEEINIETQSNYNLTRYTAYTKDSTCVFRFSVCSSGRICKNSNGVYFNYRELDSIDKRTILHERFYDTLFHLVESNHNHNIYDKSNWSTCISLNYAYTSRTITNDDCGTYETWFFNAKGEQVMYQKKFTRTGFGLSTCGNDGPINNPSTKWQSFWWRFRWRR